MHSAKCALAERLFVGPFDQIVKMIVQIKDRLANMQFVGVVVVAGDVVVSDVVSVACYCCYLGYTNW